MPRQIPRLNLLTRFIDLVGHDIVRIIDPRDGWPSIVGISLDQRELVAALHLGSLYGSHRDRDDEEVRFQNPGQGKPIIAPFDSFPLLIGVAEQDHPVLAGMEVAHRIGKVSRQSLFIPVWALREAAVLGWAEKYNAKGELIISFHPSLLQAYVEMRRSGLSLPAGEITRVVAETGITSASAEGPIKRARRAATVAIRKASFSRKVVEAYNNSCAMCGLSLDLVQAAHIYPVEAPGSQDEVWNGIALCGNHHLAFDRHMIGIQPRNLQIKVHPTIQNAKSQAARYFMDSTFKQVERPGVADSAPQDDMLLRRYDWFKRQYSWLKIRRVRRKVE